MSKNLELVNLDIDTHKVIAVTHEGQLRSFTRQQLLELLDQAQGMPLRASKTHFEASLASIGNLASRTLAKALMEELASEDQKNLTQAINNFDGIIKERANSPVYYALVELKGITGISATLKAAIDEFINKYPELKEIGLRRKVEIEDKISRIKSEKRSGAKRGKS